MQSFTWGSDEGMQAVTNRQADTFTNVYDENWSITPNPADFSTLVNALKFTANNAAEKGDLDLWARAADLLGSIAESLGIEFI